VAGDCRRLHGEELHNLYASPNVDQIREMGGARSMYWRDEKCIQNFSRKTCREELFRRSRRRWEDSIRMGLVETGWEGVYWIHLAKDRGLWRSVVNTVMNLRAPLKAGNFLTS